MESSTVFLVVPTYNEGPQLSHSIDRLLDLVELQNLNAVCVLIDDGSTDQSTQMLAETDKNGNLKILHHEQNRGIASALETGLQWVLKRASNEDFLVILEADGTNDASILSKMTQRLADGFDVVIGSRIAPGGGMKGFPILRRTVSSVGNLVMRFLIGYPGIYDYSIFYRAYRIPVLLKLQQAGNGTMFEERGFAANAEILLKIACLGGRITEVPHLYRYDLKKSISKMRLGTTTREYLHLIKRYRNPIRDALICGQAND